MNNIDDEDNELEQEFEEVSKEVLNQVNSKLNEAAKLIREAKDIARTNGHDLVEIDKYEGNVKYDQVFDVDVIKSAMNYGGWSTSSWYC